MALGSLAFNLDVFLNPVPGRNQDGQTVTRLCGIVTPMPAEANGRVPAGRVSEWLNTQGFPFEMSVARALRRAGIASIVQSAYFTDPEEGKSREIDVIARRDLAIDGNLIVTAALVVECKVAPKPWVLFVDRSEYATSVPVLQRVTNKLGRNWLRSLERREDIRDLPTLQAGPRRGYALTTARLLPDQSRDKTPDHAYEALVGATKAARALATSMDGERRCAVLLPVLVLRGQLFEASLDSNQCLQVAEIESGQVLWRNPSSGSDPVVVDVVTEEDLPRFAAEAAQTIDQLVSRTIEEARSAFDRSIKTVW